MNTFVEHPVLKDLPFELMRNPTRDGIQLFLTSRQGKRKLHGLAYALIGFVMLLLSLILVPQGLSQFLILFVWISTVFRGWLLFKSANKFKMDDAEILRQIQISTNAEG